MLWTSSFLTLELSRSKLPQLLRRAQGFASTARFFGAGGLQAARESG
jgi:hypothetical protein